MTQSANGGGRLPAHRPQPLAAVAEHGTALAGQLRDFTDEPGSDNEGVTLRHLADIFRRRKWIIILFSFFVVFAALIATYMAVPIYRATVTLQIDLEQAKVVQFEDVFPVESERAYDFYQTQYELLRSQRLARRVIDQLGLKSKLDAASQQPSLLGTLRSGFNTLVSDALILVGLAPPPVEDKGERVPLEELLLRGLVVEPIRKSRLVKIHYLSPSPRLAADVANSLAENFIQMNLERRFEASSYAKEFLEDRIKQVKARLEESEQQLVDYARQHDVINLSDKKTILLRKIEEMNNALVNAERERIETGTVYDNMRASSGQGLSMVLNSPVVQTLKETKATLQSEYQQKLLTFKPAYPRMVALRQQISEIDTQIATEVGNIRSAIQLDYKAAQNKEQQLREEIAELEREIVALQDSSIEYNVLTREASTNRELYNGLLQRMKEVGVAAGVGTNNISIVDQAQLPYTRYKPNKRVNLSIALVLGLLGGIGLAFLFEHFDDSIKSAADIEKLLKLPILGSVPLVRNNAAAAIMAQRDPQSALAEAHRSLRTALLFSTAQGAPKVLQFTSATPGEGKTTSATNTAIVFAQTGGKVLLIDGDLRNPSLHKVLSSGDKTIDNGRGLTNYLAGDATPVEIAQATAVPTLFVIPAGPAAPNPADLLASAKMLDLLAQARNKFDCVIIDSPPVLGLADAIILANVADATTLVVEAGAVRKAALQNAVKRLLRGQANIVGTVLTKLSGGRGAENYGYYYYYYGSAAGKVSGDAKQLTG